MSRSPRRTFIPFALAFTLASVSACGTDAVEPSTADSTDAAAASVSDSLQVVASTTWTGALAQLAGATDITVIAPTTILHPPDYDPKPSDLAAATDADLVVYAEFESFAPRLVDAAGADARTFPLTLENTPTMIESEVLRLAEALGTEDVARTNLDGFLAAVDELRIAASGAIPKPAPVVVAELFMSYWADWVGLKSAGTFGPAALSAGDLAGMLDLAPTLVLDNAHIPGGQALEAEGIARVELINYPGDDLDLISVFEHNHELIVQALKGEISADPNVSVPDGHTEDGHGDHDHSDTTVAEHTDHTHGG